jgi:hypothetical protein
MKGYRPPFPWIEKPYPTVETYGAEHRKQLSISDPLKQLGVTHGKLKTAT